MALTASKGAFQGSGLTAAGFKRKAPNNMSNLNFAAPIIFIFVDSPTLQM